MIEWFKISTAKKYADVTDTRTIKTWFGQGLRFIKLESGSIRIKREWIDEFLQSHETNKRTVDDLVSDICSELTK